MYQIFQPFWKIEASLYRKSFEPYLNQLIGTIENNIWHLNDDVYDHSLAVVRELLVAIDFSFIKDTNTRFLLEKYLGKDLVPGKSFFTSLLVAAFLHDIGKKDTLVVLENGQTSCTGHEAKGALITSSILPKFEELNLPEFIHRTTRIITEHTVPYAVFAPGVNLEERTAQFLIDYPDIAIELALLGYSDTRGSHLKRMNPSEFSERMNAYHAFFNNRDLLFR